MFGTEFPKYFILWSLLHLCTFAIFYTLFISKQQILIPVNKIQKWTTKWTAQCFVLALCLVPGYLLKEKNVVYYLWIKLYYFVSRCVFDVLNKYLQMTVFKKDVTRRFRFVKYPCMRHAHWIMYQELPSIISLACDSYL